jgi:hypothetical protein
MFLLLVWRSASVNRSILGRSMCFSVGQAPFNCQVSIAEVIFCFVVIVSSVIFEGFNEILFQVWTRELFLLSFTLEFKCIFHYSFYFIIIQPPCKLCRA